MRYALFSPNFGTFSDAALLAELAASAEQSGWDGWFLWDHVVYRTGNEPAADPWMALAVMAQATSRLRVGPLVTPIPRRRPWNVARQAVTLDRLSNGRAVLGVGIGTSGTREFSGFGEEQELRRRASMLDEGLDVIAALWRGQPVNHEGTHYRVEGVSFLPTPVQDPLPVWVAAVWPHRRPLRRAARWQGVFPLAVPEPAALAEITAIIGDGKDIVIEDDRYPPQAWADNGATWWLQGVPADTPIADVRARVLAGPPI
jgi:alkanesulfonate monooxygenase SsuD/methylene tetrahydromethanopterin reductase-like flavin-dependent oxidoreductase (luciferase family)